MFGIDKKEVKSGIFARLKYVIPIGSALFALYQFYDGSRHATADTYLHTLQSFGMTREEFNKDYQSIVAVLNPKHVSREYEKALALDKCATPSDSFAKQLDCINKYLPAQHHEELVELASYFRSLGTYADSDSYVKEMLQLAYSEKARMLANLCPAMQTAIDAYNRQPNSQMDGAKVFSVINFLSGAKQEGTRLFGLIPSSGAASDSSVACHWTS